MVLVPVVDSEAAVQDRQQEDGGEDQTLEHPLLGRGLHQGGVEHQHVPVDHDADGQQPGADM